MNGCLIPHTPIAVDFWKIRECPQAKVFFLTHLHGDHITGLTSSWRFPIYCSEITKQLLIHKLGIEEKLINILEIGCTAIIYLDNEQGEQMSVTAIDAQHCPGAIIILMQGYFGTILHTGDFRFNPDMITSSILSQYSGKVDTLYLDNTYCTPSCRFPVRDVAVKHIIDIIEKHPSCDVLIAMRNLGKETLLCDIALHFQEWISVSGKFYESLQIMGAPDVFDSSSTEYRIRVIPFHKVSNRFVEKVNEEHPTIVIIPTALYCGIDATPYANNKHVFVVPYSDHSSYSEIVEFVTFLKPGKIIPIVEATARGPFGCNIENRADMSQFAKFTNPYRKSTFVIPTSVQTFMNCWHSLGTVGKNGTKRKKKLNQRPNVKKMKKGVAYESPESKHASVGRDDDPNNFNGEKRYKGDTELNICHKEFDIHDKLNKPRSGDITTAKSQEIDTDTFEEQIEKVKKSFDFSLPSFDKALGQKTYSKSVIKRKCDATNNALQLSGEVEDTTKHTRCEEYVNSLDGDFDVIEEADIDWNDKPLSTHQRQQSRRSKKAKKLEANQDNDSKITDTIVDRLHSNKIQITKRKNRNQKKISDFLPAALNNSISSSKSLMSKKIEAIVLSDSLDEGGSEMVIATKLQNENEKPKLTTKSEVINAMNEARSEEDSDKLVIITDSEHMSDTDDNSAIENGKVRSTNIRINDTVVTSDLPAGETIIEPEDDVLVINDTLEQSLESISTDGLDNKDINDSVTPHIGTQHSKHTDSDHHDSFKSDYITPQIGTQHPKHVEFDEFNLDKVAGLNDSEAKCGHDVNVIHQEKKERIQKLSENMVKFEDEYYSGDEIHDESVNVNVGTQDEVIIGTIEDSLDEEACTVNEGSDEHIISVVEDSIEVMAGTQAFLNQSLNDDSKSINADFTKHNESGFDHSIEVNIGTQMYGDRLEGDGKSQFSAKLPIALDEIDGDSNDVGDGSGQRNGNIARQRTSTPNCKSNKSKYFMNSNNYDITSKEDKDTSFNVSSMKFKPLKDKGSDIDDFTKKDKVNVSISHKLGGILKDNTNTYRINRERTKSADSELCVFIKAFKHLDHIKAQKQLNGVLEMEEKLRKKAYKRYLLGVESGHYKKHSLCSFRVKPL